MVADGIIVLFHNIHLLRLSISVLKVNGGHAEPQGRGHSAEREGGTGGAEHGLKQGDLPGVRRMAVQDLATMDTYVPC